MTEREQYRAFLAALRLRHFKPHEVIDYADRVRDGVRNSLPPRSMWANIVPTLWILDNFRESTGLIIILTSIYRSPDYNAAVGSGSGSQHPQNRAIDFQVRGMGPAAVANRLLKARQANGWKGGLGKYSTFTHVDTRGSNATWGF